MIDGKILKLSGLMALMLAAGAMVTGCGSDSKAPLTHEDDRTGPRKGSTDADRSFQDRQWDADSQDSGVQGNERAPASTTPPEPPAKPAAAPRMSWKGLLMTGDDSIGAFDNARIKLAELWREGGIADENMMQLSMDRRRQDGKVRPSSQQELGQALQRLDIGDRDGCMLHFTSHGSRQGFYLKNQPTLTPSQLNQMLEQSCGARPTVILVSACYSGVFVMKEMQADNRIILTAARPDRTSLGCGAEDQYTYWDSCLIEHFSTAATWHELQQKLVSCIEEKEAGRYNPSEPQGFFGSKVRNLKIFDTTLPPAAGE
jgi:hypothetical protein